MVEVLKICTSSSSSFYLFQFPAIPTSVLESASQFLLPGWNFHRACVKPINQSGENWHSGIIDLPHFYVVSIICPFSTLYFLCIFSIFLLRVHFAFLFLISWRRLRSPILSSFFPIQTFKGIHFSPSTTLAKYQKLWYVFLLSFSLKCVLTYPCTFFDPWVQRVLFIF